MNQFSTYLIIGEAMSVFGDWEVHLHLKEGEAFKEAPLCARVWKNKRNTRLFGERKYDSPATTMLADKVHICPKCEKLRLDETPEYLYGAALEVLKEKNGKPVWEVQPVEHFHAKDYADARAKALMIHDERDVKIIEVARVVGYFVDDTKGDELSV